MPNQEREARRVSIEVFLDAEATEALAWLGIEDTCLVVAGRCYDLYRGWGEEVSIEHCQHEAVQALYRVLSGRGLWDEGAYRLCNLALRKEERS